MSAVKFGVETDPLALPATHYEIQKGGKPSIGGGREVFADRTGKEFAEQHYGDQTSYSPSYLIIDGQTSYNHESWSRGDTVNGHVIDDWTVDDGNKSGETLSVNCHPLLSGNAK